MRHAPAIAVRAALAAGIALLISVEAASGASGTVTVRATPTDPYRQCSIGSGGPDSVNYTGAEVEPQIAVNPTNRRNLIGVVQQDRWSDGGAHGLVALVSHDGGATFAVVPLPFSSCAPGGLAYERASDPWVSFGPDGTAYSVSISFDQTSSRSAVGAATSSDGGNTWTNVTEVLSSPADVFNDKETVTTDPTIPGAAYIVWDQVPDCCNYPGPSFISITTDYGQHWSTPEQMQATDPAAADIGNVVLVDSRNGTLYDVFERFFSNGATNRVMVRRSTNHGASWAAPATVAYDRSIADVDPHPGGQPVRTSAGAIPSAAIDPVTGRLYVTWEDARFTGGIVNQVVIATTRDWQHWGRPTVVSKRTGQAAFTPTVAVNTHGRVAVSYYDFRTFNRARPALPTSTWLTISPRGGTDFGPAVALRKTPFDMLKAPVSVGYFVGDYEGLVATSGHFVALFCAAKDQSNSATDCYASTVSAGN